MRGPGGVEGAVVEVVRAGVDTCRVRGAGTAPGEATETAPGGGGEGALGCGMAGRAPRVRGCEDELAKAFFAKQCNTLRRYLHFEGSLRFRAEYLFEYPIHAGVSDHPDRKFSGAFDGGEHKVEREWGFPCPRDEAGAWYDLPDCYLGLLNVAYLFELVRSNAFWNP